MYYQKEIIEECLAAFRELGDYKDSASYAERCEQYLSYDMGNHVTLGNYKGKPLTWKVIAVYERTRLLFADEIVDTKVYHTERNDTPWSGCFLRRWLNGEFIQEAFSLKERMNILLSYHENGTDPRWCIENGAPTKDKAFVFNKSELMEYLPEDKDRAIGDWWWLRGHGEETGAVHAVYDDGSIYTVGVNKNAVQVGVRPAMWVRVTV